MTRVKLPSVITPFKTWSPSALKDFEQCPLNAALQRAHKLCTVCFKGQMVKKRCSACGAVEPPKGEPLVRGDMIHEAAEMYIRGQGKIIPELTAIKKKLSDLRAAYKKGSVRVELELAFTKAWRMTQWLASDVYVRFKVDVLHLETPERSRITDWKSGRFHPEEAYDDQLRCYSVASLTAGFGKSTTTELCFTDENRIVESAEGCLTLAQLPKAQAAYDKRVARMLGPQKYIPRPGRYCRWCAYSTNKGGPCAY